FKKGALKLATKPGVPIIPISLNGTHEVYEKTGVLRGAPVDLIIHPAIETKGISKQEEKELSDVVFQIIYDGVEELKQKHENH
ncbi:MAG: 1-acyl-sn-glycerol-3-phosphate acyltransferase, partial [Anaerovoracaceae bacterium]